MSHPIDRCSAVSMGRAISPVLFLVVAAWCVRPAPAAPARRADSILEEAGVSGGLIVQVGCGDGRLTGELRLDERYVVQGLDADPGDVAEARRYLKSRGLYGPVSVDTFDGRRLPYADNLVNLVVVEEPGALPMPEILRALCPGGVAYIKQDGAWRKTVKPWPKQMDQWTHWLHGPDGNAVANDRLVGPPRSLQWIAGPLWLRHHNMTISFSAMVSANGRIFSILDDSVSGVAGLPDQWALVARDAFNGTLLWRRPVTDWGWLAWTSGSAGLSRSRFDQPPDLPRRLVAVGDRVYTALGEHAPLSMLDAATGETIRTYSGTERLSEVLYEKGRLFVSVHRPARPAPKAPVPVPVMEERVLALDAQSGEVLWRRTGLTGVASKTGPLRPYTQLYMAAGPAGLFLIDRDSILRLDPDSGCPSWRVPRPPREEIEAKYSTTIMSNLCTLVVHGDVVLLSQRKAYERNPWYEPAATTLVALSASDGTERWRFEGGAWTCYAPPDLFVIDNLVWCYTLDEPYEMVGLDPVDGAVKRRISASKAMVTEHHHRCYRNKATTRYLLNGRRGIELLDLEDGANLLNHWIRGACRYGVMPCNGLIYAPPDPCICYITAKVNGMVALSPRRVAEQGEPPAERLEKGPAYAEGGRRPAGPSSSPAPRAAEEEGDQWPTFRHDERRSGASRTPISTRLGQRWRANIGGKLSAPVVAGGRLFAAAVDEHTVYALDSATGETIWDFTCGGRIDSPPTVYQGLVLMGSADGFVYALRADDGRMAWRFQAAPGATRIGAFGQLESAWPVHGSVLIRDGRVFVAAGRSSFLDGGIMVYSLDPATGAVLQQRVLRSPDSTEDEPQYDKRLRYDMPPDRPGALSDILVGEGALVYMRHIRFDPQDLRRDLEQEKSKAEIEEAYRKQIPKVYSPGPQVASSAGLLDDSWFNQTYWSFANASQCRLLVCDDRRTYGVRAYPGAPYRHSRSKFVVGQGRYSLFADDRDPDVRRIWTAPIPIRVGAMLLARDQLFVAGAPDAAPAEDPWLDIEGRGPGRLAVFSTTDGKQLAQYPLPAPPVWNGAAAADGMLYLTLKDGHVVCFESQ